MVNAHQARHGQRVIESMLNKPTIDIVDNVTGFDELWIIGETTFMHTATKYLRSFMRPGNQRSPPYLGSRYDVKYEINYKDKGTWVQIRNSLTALMNDNWKLPNYLLIIFSNKSVQETLHYAHDLDIPMNSLSDFINRVFFERTAALPCKALRPSDPQVVVVRTVSKSQKFQDLNNFKNKRRTFNKALQRMSERVRFRSLNVDDILPGKDIFEPDGELSPMGFQLFWNYISLDIKINDQKWLEAFEEAKGPVPCRDLNYNLTQVHKQDVERLRNEALASLPRHCIDKQHKVHRDRTRSRSRDRSRHHREDVRHDKRHHSRR